MRTIMHVTGRACILSDLLCTAERTFHPQIVCPAEDEEECEEEDDDILSEPLEEEKNEDEKNTAPAKPAKLLWQGSGKQGQVTCSSV